ncbi:MAG: penicillin-binding protein activator LpoB [Candidatus Omnitrophota bacterium]
MKFLKLTFIVFFAGFLTGCASTTTTRIDATKVTDLSGYWNDTDARLTADEMIKDCLAGQWLWNFNQTNGRAPVVIVGTIRNKTFEHIESDVFIDSLQKALINSGKIKFVASSGERQEVREERRDQQAGNTEPSTITATGHETGADFMLQGNINAIQEGVESHHVMFDSEKSTSFYQVSLELIDLKTNQKLWIGQKEVKKLVQRSKVF